jgi:hypothetical protein
MRFHHLSPSYPLQDLRSSSLSAECRLWQVASQCLQPFQLVPVEEGYLPQQEYPLQQMNCEDRKQQRN